MKAIFPFIIIALLSLLLLGGCAPPGPVDEPVKAAFDELLQSDEFTPEERDAIQSISVHNDEAKVWFKPGFTNDQVKINTLAEHIGKTFATKFYDIAMDKGYKKPKYNIEIWMKVSDEKGSHKALIAEYWFNIQRDKVEYKVYGLGQVKEIR